jgi:hypothetical protein
LTSKRYGYGFIIVVATLLGALLRSDAAMANPGSHKGTKLDTIPQLFSATVGTSQMTFVDPKSGKILWKAIVQQFDAQSGLNGGVIGVMKNVDGILYENGKAADRLKSAIVTADNQKRMVTASGGVTITSLTQAGTVLTCDSVVWYTAQDKMLGTGHVLLHTGGFTQSGPSFLADTKMKSVVMPAPGPGSRHSVHAQFQP